MVVLAGIDLAWSGRNPTGLCALEVADDALTLREVDCGVRTAGELADWLEGLGEEVVAAIDAPLIATPLRRAEAEMARVYGRQGVFAYAARPAFLEAKGIAEGPRLGTLLVRRGWSLDPGDIGKRPRVAIEVFPHAIAVALLGAERIIRYKKGRLAARSEALELFRSLLHGHASFEPLAACPELAANVAAVTGRALKDREDRLDAIACALAAYHGWRYGLDVSEVFGDATNGYIAVPRRR